MAKIRDGDGVEGDMWFDESVGRKVGDGRDLFFLDECVVRRVTVV